MSSLLLAYLFSWLFFWWTEIQNFDCQIFFDSMLFMTFLGNHRLPKDWRYASIRSSRSFLNLVYVYAYGPSQIELCTWCEVGLDSSIPEYLEFSSTFFGAHVKSQLLSLWLSIPGKNVSQVVFPYSKWGPKTRSITSPGSLLEMQHLAPRQPYTTPRWFVITLHFEKHWCR